MGGIFFPLNFVFIACMMKTREVIFVAVTADGASFFINVFAAWAFLE